MWNLQFSIQIMILLILDFDSVNLFCALNYDGMLLELSEDINNDETPPDQSSAKQSTI